MSRQKHGKHGSVSPVIEVWTVEDPGIETRARESKQGMV